MAKKTVRYMEPLPPPPSPPPGTILEAADLPPAYVPAWWGKRLVREWRASAVLFAGGSYPTRSVLVHGPSGVGKTSAARWIASTLELPAYSFWLPGGIESYMGATGRNIDSALRFAAQVPCVLIADELDSIAANRSQAGSSNVGSETRRVSNALIQCLDWWHSGRRDSILFATTNLIEALDPAIRRRFEVEFEVPMPSAEELSRIAGITIEQPGMSHAEMQTLVAQARREAILDGAEFEAELRSRIARLAKNCCTEVARTGGGESDSAGESC